MPFIGQNRFRNRGLALQRRFPNVKGSQWLLDYSQGTFTRSSEAAFQDPRDSWAFKGSSESDNWKATNVPRIFDDGAILIEGARTNLARRSEELDVQGGIWINASTNASASSETAIAPDLGADADLVYFQDATTNPLWRQDISAIANDLTSSITFWFQSTGSGETEEIRLFNRQRDGATFVYTPVTASNDWQRFTHLAPNGSGSSNLAVGIQNGNAGGIKTFRAWGAQFEANVLFPSSFIRTTSASATRAIDVLTFPSGTFDDYLLTENQEWVVYPAFDSNYFAGNVTSAAAHSIFSYSGGGGLARMRLRASNTGEGGIQVLNNAASAMLQYLTGFSWSAGQRLSLTYNPTTGILICKGFTTGDGEYAPTGIVETFSGELRIGRVAGATDAFFGVIDRPRRAQ